MPAAFIYLIPTSRTVLWASSRKATLDESDPEVALYMLLKLLRQYQLKDWWLRVYEDALNKGVSPREELCGTYGYIQENNTLS